MTQTVEWGIQGTPEDGQTPIARSPSTGNPLWRTYTKFIAIIFKGVGSQWSNMPTTITELLGTTRHRTQQDLTYVTQFRFSTDIITIGNFVKASADIVCASVLAGDTVIVNGNEYTAVEGVKANDTEFSIDTSDDACATDLADSIDDDTRTGTIDDVTSTATTDTVTSVSTVAGTGGNLIAQTSSNGTRLAVEALFTLGLEANVGIQYSLDNGSNWFGLDNGTADVISTVINLMGTLGFKITAWTNITTLAKVDVLLRLVGIDGNGAIDPILLNIEVQFR